MKASKFSAAFFKAHWNTLLKSFKSTILRAFDFKGSSNRTELLYFTIGIIILVLGLNLLFSFLIPIRGVYEILFGLLTLALVLPSLALMRRRMRDVGLSVFFLLIPIVLGVLFVLTDEMSFETREPTLVYALALLTLLSLTTLFGISCRKGKMDDLGFVVDIEEDNENSEILDEL